MRYRLQSCLLNVFCATSWTPPQTPNEHEGKFSWHCNWTAKVALLTWCGKTVQQLQQQNLHHFLFCNRRAWHLWLPSPTLSLNDLLTSFKNEVQLFGSREVAAQRLQRVCWILTAQHKCSGASTLQNIEDSAHKLHYRYSASPLTLANTNTAASQKKLANLRWASAELHVLRLTQCETWNQSPDGVSWLKCLLIVC